MSPRLTVRIDPRNIESDVADLIVLPRGPVRGRNIGQHLEDVTVLATDPRRREAAPFPRDDVVAAVLPQQSEPLISQLPRDPLGYFERAFDRVRWIDGGDDALHERRAGLPGALTPAGVGAAGVALTRCRKRRRRRDRTQHDVVVHIDVAERDRLVLRA